MALLVCVSCSAAYAVGLLACPQCRSTDSYEQGQDPMPKISVHGGATDRADIPAPAPAVVPEPAPEPEPVPAKDEVEVTDATDGEPAPAPKTRKA